MGDGVVKMELTNTFISRVEQVGERSGGTLLFDQFSALFVCGKLTQNAGSHTLDVLDWRIQKLLSRDDYIY